MWPNLIFELLLLVLVLDKLKVRVVLGLGLDEPGDEALGHRRSRVVLGPALPHVPLLGAADHRGREAALFRHHRRRLCHVYRGRGKRL